MKQPIQPTTKEQYEVVEYKLSISSIEKLKSVDNEFDLQYVSNLWTFIVVYEPKFDRDYLYFICVTKQSIECDCFDFKMFANKSFITSIIDIWMAETMKNYIKQRTKTY